MNPKMPFRVSPKDKTPAFFQQGRHVLVDASGAGSGRYVMAAVCMNNGQVQQRLSSPCEAFSSVEAEKECIHWAFELMPDALVWNDCIPAIEAVLKAKPELSGRLLWPSPKMRSPFHDLAHRLSILARELTCQRTWTSDELDQST